MRRFEVYRRNLPSDHVPGNPPEQPQFQGVVFADGTVAIRWLTPTPSTTVFASLDDAQKIHGHPEFDTEWRMFE